MAVSCLSPVSTQICRPALRRAAMVSGTPSWSRSSMPVAPERGRKQQLAHIQKNNQILSYNSWRGEIINKLPKRWRFVSSRRADSNSSSSLSWMAVSACRWCWSQQAYCSLVKIWYTDTWASSHTFTWQSERLHPVGSSEELKMLTPDSPTRVIYGFLVQQSYRKGLKFLFFWAVKTQTKREETWLMIFLHVWILYICFRSDSKFKTFKSESVASWRWLILHMQRYSEARLREDELTAWESVTDCRLRHRGRATFMGYKQPETRDLKLNTERVWQRSALFQITITFFAMQSVRRPSAAYRFR